MFPVAGTFTHVHVTFGVVVLLAAVTLAGISSRCGRGMQRLSTGSGKHSLTAAPTIITHSSTICLLVLVRASPLHGNVVRYQLGLALTCNEHLLGQQGNHGLLACREAEVIHARWAMLGVMSLLLSDVSGSPFPPKEVRKQQ